MNKPIPFGKYYLLERINVGGMAEVFKAKAFGVEGFERLVAVKRILPNIAEDEEFITMFIDEAKIAVQLQHANVAQIFDLGKVEDSYFIALEYVHGRDLRAIFDHLRKNGVTGASGAPSEKMPTSQACFIVMQLCEGLDYAHNKRDAQGRELNLVHRDVSPQNVLIGYDGEIKLVDFGIAKAAGKASKTQAGILKGKFGYMSPEQVRGLPVDRRSDIFALGIVLYELLTGERLFIGESDFSTLEKVRNVEILPPSSFNKRIPPELERIVLKALAKDADDRYQNAIDLHDDLQAFLYSVGEFYSRKDLAAWMKKTFALELAEENAKNAEYEQLEEPTPAPIPAGKAGGSRRQSGGGLEWDEEELETQIFDKQPLESVDFVEESDNELASSDLFLEGDDKTVAGAPPPDVIAEAERVRAGGSGLASRGGGPPPGISAYRAPSGASRQFGTPSPLAAAPSRSTAMFPSATDPRAPGPNGQKSPSQKFPQTLMGMPVPNLAAPSHLGGAGAHRPSGPGYAPPGGAMPPGAGPIPGVGPGPQGAMTHSSRTGQFSPTSIPERRPLETFTQRGSGGGRVLTALLVIAALGVGGFGGYKYFTREGKLLLVVNPSDATLAIDGTTPKGAGPFPLAPGAHTLTVSREGYVRKDQAVDIQAGQVERLEVQLEPSADTGFELTSEPSGALVWLDGGPFTGKDPAGPQAKTNFKAYNVMPGRHVLEIKGDPRFEDWKYEFYQEPGKMHPIQAVLQPRKGGAAPTPAKPGAAAPSTTTVPPVAAASRPVEPPKPIEGAKAAPLNGAPPKGVPAPARATAEGPKAPVEAPKPGAAEAASPADPAKTAAKPIVRRPVALGPRTARAEAGAPESPAVERAAAGGGGCVVTIGAKPWAEVSIDGKSTGKITPLVDYEIPCGKHRLTFKNGDLKIEKTETISVRPGEKFKKVFQLVDPEE